MYNIFFSIATTTILAAACGFFIQFAALDFGGHAAEWEAFDIIRYVVLSTWVVV